MNRYWFDTNNWITPSFSKNEWTARTFHFYQMTCRVSNGAGRGRRRVGLECPHPRPRRGGLVENIPRPAPAGDSAGEQGLHHLAWPLGKRARSSEDGRLGELRRRGEYNSRHRRVHNSYGQPRWRTTTRWPTRWGIEDARPTFRDGA